VRVQSQLDYIDYDTKDHTYDRYVPRIYETMEVLFNYKRTVEDFKRCGTKAKNPYNFPFVSDCVGSPSFMGPCKDSALPVPCGDGTCRSDYVDCLRAMSKLEMARDSDAAAAAEERAAADAVASPLFEPPHDAAQGDGGADAATGDAAPAPAAIVWSYGAAGKLRGNGTAAATAK
jgi:hypothetical protein